MKRTSIKINKEIQRMLFVLAMILTCNLSFAQLNGINYIDSTGTSFSGNPGGVAGKTYKNFVDAVSALNSYGVSGPVTFMVAKGTYIGQVTLNAPSGVSATNTITFDGGAGNAPTRILQYSASSSGSAYVFELNASSYIRIKNLKIVSMGTSYGEGIHMYGATTHIIIKNCIVTYGGGSVVNGVSNMNLAAFVITNTNTAGGTTHCGSNTAGSYDILIDSCTTIGGGCGVIETSSGTDPVTNTSNIIISNNRFINFGYDGIYHSQTKGLAVLYNYFQGYSGFAGYAMYGCNGGVNAPAIMDIQGNQIYRTNQGIWWQTINVRSTGNKIVNNIIDIGSGTAIAFPYESNFNVWHNSVLMEQGTATALNFAQSASYNGHSIKNNNFAYLNSGTGQFWSTSSVIDNTLGFTIDYNNYYRPGTANLNVYTNGTGGTTYTFANVKGQNGFNNTFFNQPPGYIGITDLHYDPLIQPMYGDAAIYTAGVTTDIDKDPRCPLAPTIGADESKYVLPPPNTSFIIQPDTVFAKSVTDFLNPGDPKSPYTYKWYVDGAFKASTFNFSTSFATAGSTHSVKLVASAFCGKSDSTTKTFLVMNPVKKPVANFITPSNIVNVGANVPISDLSLNGPTNWTWTVFPATAYDPMTNTMQPSYAFTSGTNMNSQNPTLIFNFAGSYTICLRVSNSFGADTVCIPDFIVARQSVNMCSATISNSNYGILYDDGGPTANYGNGKTCTFLITPCAPNLKLKINSFNLIAGDYLRIYDGSDATGKKLYDTLAFPAGFTGDKNTNPNIPTNIVSSTGRVYIVFMTDASSTGTGFEIEWYGSPTNYDPPVASFISDSILCKDRTYTFINTSTGYGNKYFWDLDFDGYIDATTDNATFTYINPTIYAATLYVENCNGKDTFVKMVNVLLPTTKPIVKFGAALLTPTVNTDIVKLIDSSYICADQWEWKFSPNTVVFKNGTTKNSMNPDVMFTATGCYNVKLIASCNGKTDSLEKICYITALNYCVPTVGNFSSDIGISRVRLANLDNTSAITNIAYWNYSGTLTANLIKNVNYKITVNRITSYNPVAISVWIDYDHNGSFDDPGETVASTSSNAGLTWTSSFTVPLTVKSGGTKMRIGTNFNNLKNRPCGTNEYGEYEDYNVNITTDLIKPVITMKGLPLVQIEAGTHYVDSGATAFDNMDGDITARIITSNNVDSSIPGIYYVIYNVTDVAGNKAIPVQRTVKVTPDVTKPVLTLSGKDTVYVEVYTSYVEPGYSAIDNPWGINLTSSVVRTGSVDTAHLGTYKLTYTVSDAASNTTSKDRIVIVQDKTFPTISVLGLSTVYVPVYGKYTDAGVKDSDNYCKTLVPVITSNVDTSKVGTYSVQYCITDCNGNGPVCATRTVIVYDSVAPVLTFKTGEDTIITQVGHQYGDPGLTITDNYYKNLIPVISGTFYIQFPTGMANKLGLFTIIFTVTDGSGNKSAITRYVKVVDTEKPVITLIGAEIDTIPKTTWPVYHDKGYTVTDNYWPASSIKVDTIGWMTHYNKDTVFYIRYKATDSSGNIGYSKQRAVVVTGVSSINDNEASRFIRVYPNPATDMVTISLTLPGKEDVDIRIADVLGQDKLLVFKGNTGSVTFTQDIRDMSQGVYFIRFTYRNNTYVHSLIIR